MPVDCAAGGRTPSTFAQGAARASGSNYPPLNREPGKVLLQHRPATCKQNMHVTTLPYSSALLLTRRQRVPVRRGGEPPAG